MKRILQLSPDIITKIAAGEVIERPGSVVKELLENSIDAGSTRIDIDLDAGGTDLIRVVDDGHGIVADDLALAFASHATSKLQSAEDLFAINTMGFRGEALASIGGVARVTLQSRTHDRESGSELHCDGGELSPIRPWNGAPGTRIEVRHLFFNVPVRKKFLKSVATELGHVCETVTRIALANPDLHITLRHNGKLVYEVPASAGLADRISLFFGGDVRDALYELDSGSGPVRLTGFIADPNCDRGNNKLQYLFVNGRWFRDRSVAHAMQEAFRGLLMSGRYAVGFLFLTVPPDKIDVNVHPTKAEVRFQENSLIYSLVRSTVKHRLLKENLVPRWTVPVGVEPTEWRPGDRGQETVNQGQIPGSFSRAEPNRLLPQPIGPVSPRWEAAERSVAPWDLPDHGAMVSEPLPTLNQPANLANVETFVPHEASEPVAPTHQSTPLPANTTGMDGTVISSPRVPTPAELNSAFNASKPAMQIQDSYLVLETNEGMLVIDQHALHERILFEQLRRRVRDGKLEVQRLLIPEPIDLPAEQAALVLEAADALRELGLEVSEFGGNTILLSSYPTLLGRKPPHEIFKGVVDYLLNKERPPTKDAMLHLLMAT
ncbi:MAG TPA: DNA mismatch repair endonuclease MutL, partial [Gemmata sp.]|nr:DNA mismatch repair endonuclease MutL [Gemmata sp.]